MTAFYCRPTSNPARSHKHYLCFRKSGVSMKAILCSQYCQPDDLVLADVPDPVAGPNEAVIVIKSAALNFFDILMIQGKYQIKPPFPFSPAAEVAGVNGNGGLIWYLPWIKIGRAHV